MSNYRGDNYTKVKEIKRKTRDKREKGDEFWLSTNKEVDQRDNIINRIREEEGLEAAWLWIKDHPRE